MTAARLSARIAELEQSTAAAFEAIGAAEIALSKVIADGGNVDAAHAELAKRRDIATGSVAALKRLDAELYETAEREYSEGIASYNATLEREFQKIGADAERCMKPLEKVLASAFADPRATLAALHTQLLQSVWSGLQETYGAKYNELVPAPPKGVEPRNEYGRRLTEQEQNAGFSSPYKFEHGPPVVHSSPPIRQWWKE